MTNTGSQSSIVTPSVMTAVLYKRFCNKEVQFSNVLYVYLYHLQDPLIIPTEIADPVNGAPLLTCLSWMSFAPCL